MPAISPTQLKIQANKLAALYIEPSRFIQQYKNLLERYADRSYRPSEASLARTLLFSYHAPAQVNKQIASAVLNAAKKDHPAVLDLCNALWNEANYECRMLASLLLGQLHNLPDALILETIQRWQPYDADEQLQQDLFANILSRSIRENLPGVLEIADQWLTSGDHRKIKTGLFLLARIVNEPGFDNGPAIFRRVVPFIRQAPIELRSALTSLVEPLAKKFPQEITYLFLESLKVSENPDAPLIIRQVLSQLPFEMQKTLRQALLELKRSS